MWCSSMSSHPNLAGAAATPIIADAAGYDAERMLAVARRYGHECAFVCRPRIPPSRISGCGSSFPGRK